MPIPTIQETAGVLADPELRFTSQGKAVLSIRLAFNDSRYNEETRQWENTKTFYVDATAWEQTAERLADQTARVTRCTCRGGWRRSRGRRTVRRSRSRR